MKHRHAVGALCFVIEMAACDQRRGLTDARDVAVFDRNTDGKFYSATDGGGLTLDVLDGEWDSGLAMIDASTSNDRASAAMNHPADAEAGDGAVPRDAMMRWELPAGFPPADRAVAVVRGLGSGGCILTVSGAVWCWGTNLPRVHPTDSPLTPQRVEGLPPIRQIVSVGGSMRAVDMEGRIWEWSWYSCLRDCQSCAVSPHPWLESAPSPVGSLTETLWVVFRDGSAGSSYISTNSVACAWRSGWQRDVISVEESSDFALNCALMTNARIQCFVDLGHVAWVQNRMFYGFRATPLEYPGLSDVASFVFINSGTQCALLRSGEVRCWGVSDCAQTGSADGLENCTDDPFRFFYCYRAPRPVPGITDAVQIRPWASGACVIRRDGTVWCWGRLPRGTWGIFDGQYGLERDPGNTLCLRGPAPIQGLRDVVDLALGGGWCAVIRDGRVFCYGGSPGDGTDGSQGDPWPPREVHWGP